MNDRLELSVRLAGNSDIPRVIAILRDAARVPISKGITDQWPLDFESGPLMDAANTATLYVAEDAEGLVVGCFILQWADELWWGIQPPTAGYVHRLAVASSARGSGAGAQMLDWISRRIIAEGRDFVRLDCTAHNRRLRRYYEDLGFRWVRDETVNGVTSHPVADALYERSCHTHL